MVWLASGSSLLGKGPNWSIFASMEDGGPALKYERMLFNKKGQQAIAVPPLAELQMSQITDAAAVDCNSLSWPETDWH